MARFFHGDKGVRSLCIALIMALVGGYLDIYTYLARGKVFANTQTGNLVLLGYNLAERNWMKVVYYIFPIVAFMVGVGLAELVEHRWDKARNLHWIHITMAVEMIALLGVMFIPQGDDYNVYANVTVSFVCGLQVQTFRKVNGVSYSTTMFTGNLKNAAERLSNYAITSDEGALEHGLMYCMIIGMFILGAYVGDLLTEIWNVRSVAVVDILLVIVFILVYFEERKKETLRE